MLILFLIFYFSCLLADFGRDWFFPLKREDDPETNPELNRDTARVISLQDYHVGKEITSSKNQYMASGN